MQALLQEHSTAHSSRCCIRRCCCPILFRLSAELSFLAFPYPPYDIQLGFMRSLYLALERGGVGLFESPTGM